MMRQRRKGRLADETIHVQKQVMNFRLNCVPKSTMALKNHNSLSEPVASHMKKNKCSLKPNTKQQVNENEMKTGGRLGMAVTWWKPIVLSHGRKLVYS